MVSLTFILVLLCASNAGFVHSIQYVGAGALTAILPTIGWMRTHLKRIRLVQETKYRPENTAVLVNLTPHFLHVESFNGEILTLQNCRQALLGKLYCRKIWNLVRLEEKSNNK